MSFSFHMMSLEKFIFMCKILGQSPRTQKVGLINHPQWELARVLFYLKSKALTAATFSVAALNWRQRHHWGLPSWELETVRGRHRRPLLFSRRWPTQALSSAMPCSTRGLLDTGGALGAAPAVKAKEAAAGKDIGMMPSSTAAFTRSNTAMLSLASSLISSEAPSP